MKQPIAPKFKVGDVVYSKLDGLVGDVLSLRHTEFSGYFYKVSLRINTRKSGRPKGWNRRVELAEILLDPAVGSKKATSWDQERV